MRANHGYYSGTVTAIDQRPDSSGTLTIKTSGSAESQRFAVKATDNFYVYDADHVRPVSAAEFAAQVEVGDDLDAEYSTSSRSTFSVFVGGGI